MKKVILVTAVIAATFFRAPASFAEESDGIPEILHSTMVGTPDGGALVLYGHTLTKYSIDLDVVKTVDVRVSAKPKQDVLSGDSMFLRGSHQWKDTDTATETRVAAEPSAEL